MTILYVETNFIMSVATGRDAHARELLVAAPRALRLCMPSPCFMEALIALEQERKQVERFRQALQNRIVQAERDRTSDHAMTLLDHLRESDLGLVNHFADVKARFDRVMIEIARGAEAIAPDPIAVESGLNAPIVGDDATDDLILRCILGHAARDADPSKAFLSGNTRDFGQAAARQALREAGIRAFTKCADVLGWLGSLPAAGGDG